MCVAGAQLECVQQRGSLPLACLLLNFGQFTTYVLPALGFIVDLMWDCLQRQKMRKVCLQIYHNDRRAAMQKT